MQPVGTIIGCEQKTVTNLFKFRFEDNEILTTGTNNRCDMVASQFERFGDRISNSCADTTANHSHLAEILDLGRIAKGTQDIMDDLSWLERLEHHGGFADRLNDQSDGAFARIVINNRHRHTFTAISEAQYHELACFGFTGNVWGINDILIDLLC